VKVGKDVNSAGPVQVRLLRAGHCLGTRRLDRWGGDGRFSISEAGEYQAAWRLPGTAEVVQKIEGKNMQNITVGAR
jgi:hypothetical protein